MRYADLYAYNLNTFIWMKFAELDEHGEFSYGSIHDFTIFYL